MRFTPQAAITAIAPAIKEPGNWALRLERDPSDWPELWGAIQFLQRGGYLVMFDQGNSVDRSRASGDRRGNRIGDWRDYVLTPKGVALFYLVFPQQPNRWHVRLAEIEGKRRRPSSLDKWLKETRG